jgi:hypothetical protein
MGIAEAHSTGKDHVPVPTQEDRLAALERKVAMLELLRSQDERKAEEALPPAQARTMKEINEDLTILLGVTASQAGISRSSKRIRAASKIASTDGKRSPMNRADDLTT